MENKINAHHNILELIGNTPLVKLNRIADPLIGNFYAKVEAFNPGHSSKDRVANFIIEEAERKGLLKPGSTIIETTSGNTGFSIAMVSIIKGYECILAVSSKSSIDKMSVLLTLLLMIQDRIMRSLNAFIQRQRIVFISINISIN